jgi:hypothetical protein
VREQDPRLVKRQVSAARRRIEASKLAARKENDWTIEAERIAGLVLNCELQTFHKALIFYNSRIVC